MIFVASLDELNKLPDYVVKSSDMIPSARLEDGDMQFLLNKCDKLEAELASVKQILYTNLHSFAYNTDTTRIVGHSVGLQSDNSSMTNPVSVNNEGNNRVQDTHLHIILTLR